MQITRDGYLFKLAFGWKSDFSQSCMDDTNLCAVFWHTILGLFVCWPLRFVWGVLKFGWMLISAVVQGAVCLVSLVAIGALLAQWDKYLSLSSDLTDIDIPKWWPRIRDVPVMPFFIWLPALVVWLIWQFEVARLTALWIAGAALVAFLIVKIHQVRERRWKAKLKMMYENDAPPKPSRLEVFAQESEQMLRAGYHAFKGRFCPIIKIVKPEAK